jgi:hypothetical protein
MAALLGVIGAAVGVHAFRQTGVTIRGWSCALAVLAAGFVLFASAGFLQFGIWLTVASIVAYPIIHGVIGFLIGGVVVTLWK